MFVFAEVIDWNNRRMFQLSLHLCLTKKSLRRIFDLRDIVVQCFYGNLSSDPLIRKKPRSSPRRYRSPSIGCEVASVR
jgi:hypothetical protein